MNYNLLTDPDYLSWVHELTIAGYDRDIMIPAEHGEAIMGIYAMYKDQSIEQCLDAYEDFVRRWNALTNEGVI